MPFASALLLSQGAAACPKFWLAVASNILTFPLGKLMPLFESTVDNPGGFSLPPVTFRSPLGQVHRTNTLLFPFAFLGALLAACTRACPCLGQPHTSAPQPQPEDTWQVSSLPLETSPGCTSL